MKKNKLWGIIITVFLIIILLLLSFIYYNTLQKGKMLEGLKQKDIKPTNYSLEE